MTGTTAMTGTTGKLIGICRRTVRRGPMALLQQATILVDVGLTGDTVGPRHPRRLVTVLALEDWIAALAQLNAQDMLGGIELDWTTRRANLLVEGLRLPRAKGAALRIGPVELVVTGQTHPCARMDAAQPGLLKALGTGWRGGVTCTVAAGGDIALGDPAAVISSPPEQRANRLP
jgi:MOSC domain-containing protein YiiM